MMRIELQVAVAILVVVSGNQIDESSSVLSNDLGDHFDWTSWDLAPEKASKAGKPLMVILHKSWCPSCKKLKEWFRNSQAISGLSKSFVMVNAGEGQEPQTDPKFDQDGTYIPRVFFLTPSGEVLNEIVNDSGNSNYKYHYFNEQSLVNSMKRVLKKNRGGRGQGWFGKNKTI